MWEVQIQCLPAAEWCSALAAFVVEHGRLPKAGETFQRGGRELWLGKWLINRRQDEKEGLALQLKAAMEASAGQQLAGTLWEVQRQLISAAEQCGGLSEFVAQQGRLPKQIETFQHGRHEAPLGRWLNNRQNEEKKGRLAPQLKAAIEAAVGQQLSADLWAVREVNRSALCSALAAFVEQHGSLPKQREIFQHGGCELQLGKWLHSRRQEERNGKLAPQLKAAIETAAGTALAGTMWGAQKRGRPAATPS
eukprot:scaffold12.g7964.t1